MAEKQPAQRRSQGKDHLINASIFGFDPGRSLLGGPGKATPGVPTGRAILVGQGADPGAALARLGLDLPRWQLEQALRRRGEVCLCASATGPLWLLLAQPRSAAPAHGGLLDYSPYGVARDLAGGLAAQAADLLLGEIRLDCVDATAEEQLGALVGFEVGSYRFKSVRQPKPGQAAPRLAVHDIPPATVERAAALAASVNMARHLVNMPAGELDPETFAAALTELYAGSQTMTVDVWSGKRLEKERLGLLRAVGQGATAGPALVHLRYRPKKARNVRPLAFVGKGVTFDTGGLDLKDAASMRMMKKDMGGSASLAGLAYWLDRSGLDLACDVYLALAENSVDAKAFHPGDVIVARSGTTVEIDNTDAEGRLVLADALDVAVQTKGREAPALVIDLATLTGAMRVALGTRLAGMFATDDQLAAALLAAGQRRADPAWRMPLYGDYLAGLKSTVADLANSGPSRFGGAITAALFLQRFVGQVPWAHFDMYAWTEANTGACSEVGGNGQCVQLLADFLEVYEP